MTPVRPRYNLGRWKGCEAVDPAPLTKALQAARAAGISPSEIARHARMDRSSVSHYTAGRAGNGVSQSTLLLSSTVDRILDAVEYLIAHRRGRLAATLNAVKRARPLLPETRFPTERLRALIARQCGGLQQAVDVGRLTDNDRRQLYRLDTVDLDTADRICVEFGTMLEELYPDLDNEGAA